MEGIEYISQYRNRLDKTLAAHELSNVEAVKKLVKAQLLNSSNGESEDSIETIVEKRTEEVFNCLQMLKSSSEYDNADQDRDTRQRKWKLKQETEEYRVMYHEGPEGSPFHSLLVEGYVDGPLDVCLCIAWESSLYGKWWPQSNIPTFKLLSSECLQKVRIGEQICLVRAKLSWPLSSREVIVHFFEFEFFHGDLIIVLFHSISDLESVDGFPKNAIPDNSKGIIRIDMLGGMAMQKVSASRSYFRTITNMDMKLDFVPPSVLNFISRQLIGSGFLLYKKEVASVSKGDEEFSEALKDPLHCRIREALYSNNKLEPSLQSEITHDASSESSEEEEVNVGPKTVTEIEEIQEVNVEASEVFDDLALNNNYKEEESCCSNSNKRRVAISPPVKQALETLERAISLFREYRSSDSRILKPSSSLPKKSVQEPKPSEESLKGKDNAEVSKDKSMERASHELRISFGSHSSRRMGSNPYLRESNHSNKIAPASPEVNILHPSEGQHLSLYDAFSFHKTGAEASFIVDNNIEVDDKQHTSAGIANGSFVVSKSKAKHKKWRKFCCFHSSSSKQI